MAGRGPAPADEGALGPIHHALARALGPVLRPMLGDAVRLEVEEPRTLSRAALAGTLADHGHHALLAVEGDPARVLVSLAAGPLMAALDGWFGGTGRAPDAPPAELPDSARLMAERLVNGIVAALGTAWSADRPRAFSVARAEERLAHLPWLTPADAVVHVRLLAASPAMGAAFPVDLSYPAAALAGWTGATRQAPARAAPARVDGLVRGPLGAVALPLRAVVDEPRLPLGRVSRLAVGDCIPLGVGGHASLRLGDRTVGEGVVGTAAGRVAIRVTSASPPPALAAPTKDLP